MPNKIKRTMDVEWTEEEQEILQAACDLCREMTDDEEMEEWARDNCRASFWDVMQELQDFINNSI